jgi:hypothetical protein
MPPTHIALAVIVVLWLIMMWSEAYSVKVYRFYRPWCGWCKKSQAEWDRFKRKCWFRMIQPVDVNLEEENPGLAKKLGRSQAEFAKKLGVTSVPNVTAVYPDGTARKFEGDRVAESYMAWLEDNEAGVSEDGDVWGWKK